MRINGNRKTKHHANYNETVMLCVASSCPFVTMVCAIAFAVQFSISILSLAAIVVVSSFIIYDIPYSNNFPSISTAAVCGVCVCNKQSPSAFRSLSLRSIRKLFHFFFVCCFPTTERTNCISQI